MIYNIPKQAILHNEYFYLLHSRCFFVFYAFVLLHKYFYAVVLLELNYMRTSSTTA